MAVTGKTFSIANISIQASADTVEKRVGALSGVRTVNVNISSNTMYVEYDPEAIDEKVIIQTVRACGYDAYTREMPAVSETEPAKEGVSLNRPLAASFALCGLIGLLWFVPAAFWIGFIAVLIVLWLSPSALQDALNEIRTEKKPGYGCLRTLTVVLCLGAATGFGMQDPRQGILFQFTAALILSVFTLEDQLIENSRLSASKPVSALLDSLPKTASVYDDRREKLARTEELREDQIIMVRPGEAIPADGRVIRGFATMDESALTGMDTPIEKSEGSYVYANSICLTGSVEVRAERTGSATAMMRLASLAEKTASDDSFQSPFKNFGRYLLLYIVIAACTAAGGWLFSGKTAFFALNVMLSVLGCASLRSLKLSSENEVMSAAGQAMTNHVLFRSVEALEMTGKTDYAVIEQNGAITDSELTVTDFITAEGMSEGRLEYIAYALESRSDRPFAKAITRYLRSKKMTVTDLQEFTRLSRRGRGALQSLSSFQAGSYEEIVAQGIEPGEWEETIARLRSEGKRVLIFTEKETIIGVIAAVRPLIPGAPEALKGLQEAGCEIWLLMDGSEDEASVLNGKLNPDNMLVHPEKDERERLLAGLDEDDTITAYISTVPEETSQEDVDVTVAIGTGAEPDKEKAGILLTRNRLSDFLYALNLSRQLNERIARKQMAILIYLAEAVLLFGFLLPAVTDFPLIPAVAVLCACLCLHAVINGKKEFR